MDNFLGFKDIDDAIGSTNKTSQVEALSRIMSGDSVFLSGVAGAGKSFVINHAVDIMKDYFLNAGCDEKILRDVIAVTGATGLAAANLNGITIHSYSGLGVCNADISDNPKKVFDKEFRDEVGISYGFFSSYKKMKNLRILIIDEVSMLSALFIDNLDTVLKMAKRSNKPFGGVTMVFVGDFMQLPPVAKNGDHEKSHMFAFEADSWKELNPKLLFMDKSRRSSDYRLNTILNDMRESKVSTDTKKYLSESMKRTAQDSYVRLFIKNMDVDKYNDEKLEKLNAPVHLAKSSPIPVIENKKISPNLKELENIKKKKYESFYKQLMLPADGIIKLKVGAVVTITHNFAIDQYNFFAVNGDTGVIVKTRTDSVDVRLNRNGKTVNIPYVTKRVSFGIPYKDNSVIEKSASNRGNDKVKNRTVRDHIAIKYLPVKLSFATTIHKSQGQTLHGVVVDLRDCFLPGLGYVALSRVADLNNLVVSGIDKSAFRAFTKCSQMSKIVEEEAEKNSKEFSENRSMYNTFLENTQLLNVFWDDDFEQEIDNDILPF